METAWRRIGVGFLGLALATLLLRNQLGEALVVRGDELLVRNDYGAARAHYERALFFDRESEAAVDRIAFVASQRRSRPALMEGILVTSRYLQYHSKSPVVLFDRGLCFLLLREYSRALPDFRAVALLTREPQAYVFAGWAARRSGSAREAVSFWKTALSLRHGYRPAMLALHELQK